MCEDVRREVESGFGFMPVTVLVILALALLPGLARGEADPVAIGRDLPLVLVDGRTARVSILRVPAPPDRSEPQAAALAALDAALGGVDPDCVLSVQVVGAAETGVEGDPGALGIHRLARERAEAVRAHLAARGLPADRITAVWDYALVWRARGALVWLFRLDPEDCGADVNAQATPTEGPKTATSHVPAADSPVLDGATSETGAEEDSAVTAALTPPEGPTPGELDAPRVPAASLHPPQASSQLHPVAPSTIPAQAATAALAQADASANTPQAAGAPAQAMARVTGDGVAGKAEDRTAPRATTGVLAHGAMRPAESDDPEVAGERADESGSVDLAAIPLPVRETSARGAVAGGQKPEAAAAGGTMVPAGGDEARSARAPARDDIRPAGGTAEAAGETDAPGLRLVFDVNSSFLGQDNVERLRRWLSALPAGRWRAELVVAVGPAAGVRAESRAQAEAYERWLAERRAARVERQLRERLGAALVEVRVRHVPDDPSRSVEIRLWPEPGDPPENAAWSDGPARS